MKNFDYKRELILWLLLLLPFIYIAYVWSLLPDRIAIHFDLAGHPNGWGPRESVLIIPFTSLASYLLILLLPYLDPKRMADEDFSSMFYKIRVTMVIFLSAVSVFVAYNGISNVSEHGIGKIMSVSAFLFLSILGNFMINIRPNWFVGVRTPWTLSSDTVWRRTHQVVGRLWFYGGLACAVLVFFAHEHWVAGLILAFILGTAAFAFAYSFWLYKKEREAKTE